MKGTGGTLEVTGASLPGSSVLLFCYPLTPTTWLPAVCGKMQCCSAPATCPDHIVTWWAHNLGPRPVTTSLWRSHHGHHTLQASCCSSGERASTIPTPFVCLSVVLATCPPGESFWLAGPGCSFFLPALPACTPEGHFLLAWWLWSSSGPGNPLIFSIHWMSPSTTPSPVRAESHPWGEAPSKFVHP